MKQTEKKAKYFMYVRKSNEAEDRQVQSIPDQIKELEIIADKYNLEIVGIFQESRSAKAPGRAEFTKMVERITKGEANGILCWKLNRLARNPVDGGTISWLLQQGVVQHIQTYSQSYYPTDNVLVMAVELGMANQYVRDLSVDTKRGLRTRENEKGYPNGVAPMGFLNDMSEKPGNRGWLVDKERFSLVKQLLDLFATGKYSIRQLMRIANDEMGLRTPVHKRQGGKKVVLSYMAGTFLRNPVYAGFFFVGDGSRRELNKAMPRVISEEQYWHIQKLIGNKGRPRPWVNVNSFAYTGPTVCGGCSGTVTAEHKYQLICPDCRLKFSYPNKDRCPGCEVLITEMENPTYLHYIYYRCTRWKNPSCSEGYVTETSIDHQLSEHFAKSLQMSDALARWCADNIKALDTSEKQNEFERKLSLEKTLEIKRKEFRELALMRARGVLNDEELVNAKAPLKAEIDSLEAELESLSNVDPARLQKAYRAFELAKGVAEIFKSGTTEEKRELLAETVSNLSLKDKKVSVCHVELYSLIVNGLLTAKSQSGSIEPEIILANKHETEAFASVRTTLLRG